MTDIPGILDLVERIYATALLPEADAAWGQLLIELERYFRGSSCILMLQDRKTSSVSFLQAPTIESTALGSYSQHYASVNPWWSAMSRIGQFDVYSGEMLVPESDLVRSEFHSDWLRANRFHSGGGCLVQKDASRLMVFTFLKPPGMESVTPEEFELMRKLVPHFQRAAQIRRQFGQVELKSHWATEALDSLSVGIVLLRPPRCIVFMNKLAAAMLGGQGSLFIDATGAIRARRPGDERQLTRLIECARATTLSAASREGGAFIIAGTDESEALSVLVASFNPCFDVPAEHGPYVTLFITAQGRELAARADLLSALYGLTRAESQVLCKLVGGMPIHAIAMAHGVSVNTVRNQVQRLLEKTGTHRQSTLVARVLSDIGPYR